MPRDSDRVSQSSALTAAAASLGKGFTGSLDNLAALAGNIADRDLQKEREASRLAESEAAKAESARRFGIEQDRLSKAAAEGARRFDIGQGRLDKEEGIRDQKRLAESVFNRDIAGYNPNTAKYTLDALDPSVAKEVSRGRSLISGAQKDFEKYLSGAGSEKELNETLNNYKKYLDSQNLSASSKVDALNNYREGILGIREELGTLDDKSRLKRVEDLSQRKFGHRLDAIDKDISSGKYLLKSEKIKSYISKLPKSVLDNVPYETLYRTAAQQIGGTTADELLKREESTVKSKNAANLAMYNKSMAAINKKISNTKGGSSKWKVGDLKTALEGVGNIDIGPLDNVKVKTAANDMLSKGYHPMAVYAAIQQSIDRSISGDSFFTKEDDKAAYDNFTALTALMSDNLTGSGKRGNYSTRERLNLPIMEARDLPAIRKSSVNFKGDTVLLKDLLSPKTKALMSDKVVKNSNVQIPRNLKAPTVVKPTKPVRLSAYGNPLPENFRLNAPQQAGVDLVNYISDDLIGGTSSNVKDMMERFKQYTNRQREGLKEVDKYLE